MVSASRPGWTARVTSLLFGQAATRAWSRTGDSGQVSGRRTLWAGPRDSAVSLEPLGETGEGLQRHGRVDAHGCRLCRCRGTIAGGGCGVERGLK